MKILPALRCASRIGLTYILARRKHWVRKFYSKLFEPSLDLMEHLYNALPEVRAPSQKHLHADSHHPQNIELGRLALNRVIVVMQKQLYCTLSKVEEMGRFSLLMYRWNYNYIRYSYSTADSLYVSLMCIC